MSEEPNSREKAALRVVARAIAKSHGYEHDPKAEHLVMWGLSHDPHVEREGVLDTEKTVDELSVSLARVIFFTYIDFTERDFLQLGRIFVDWVMMSNLGRELFHALNGSSE